MCGDKSSIGARQAQAHQFGARRASSADRTPRGGQSFSGEPCRSPSSEKRKRPAKIPPLSVAQSLSRHLSRVGAPTSGPLRSKPSKSWPNARFGAFRRFVRLMRRTGARGIVSETTRWLIGTTAGFRERGDRKATWRLIHDPYGHATATASATIYRGHQTAEFRSWTAN